MMAEQEEKAVPQSATEPSQTLLLKPVQSIQKILSQEQQQSIEKPQSQKVCVQCGIRHGQMRELVKVILITFQDTDESYCDICLGEYLSRQQKQMKRIQEKYIYQKQFQTSISQSDIKVLVSVEEDANLSILEKQVERLEKEESELDGKLKSVKLECDELQRKVLNLEQKEDKYWSDMNKFEKRALKLEEKSFIANKQKQIQKNTLENMGKTCVSQAFFKIDIEDSYSQVYGLTIGKKPDQLEVNWQQTNAGIGHLLLAYNYLVLKYGITYTRIEELRIKGNLSEITLRNVEGTYPIAYSRENEKVFGMIMECLLIELGDLAQHIQEIQNIQYSEELKLPFAIDKKEAKIADFFVNPMKLEEKSKWNQWTKAMRYFLINFKHVMTVSALNDPYL